MVELRRESHSHIVHSALNALTATPEIVGHFSRAEPTLVELMRGLGEVNRVRRIGSMDLPIASSGIKGVSVRDRRTALRPRYYRRARLTSSSLRSFRQHPPSLGTRIH